MTARRPNVCPVSSIRFDISSPQDESPWKVRKALVKALFGDQPIRPIKYRRNTEKFKESWLPLLGLLQRRE
jgi:hypothetical protein